MIIRDLRASPNTPAADLARRVRVYLGISLDEQISWPSAEVALERWRGAFAAVGVFVFKDAFKAPRYAGFCLYDPEFPIIYVNNSAAKERQIFTLFHELGHLLFHTSGIDFRSDELLPELAGDARRIEVLCNRFAGVFLVPDDALREAMRGRSPDQATARELARRFNVSWLVVYRRFLDLGFINRDTYTAAQEATEAAAQSAEGGEEGGGGNYYNTTLSYLGRDFVRLAMREYYQNRISEAQLAEHLGVPLKNLSGIEDRFLKAQANRA